MLKLNKKEATSMKLMIILGSSRQGRKGEVVARWVRKHAAERFEVDFVDLQTLNLPFFNEPLSPFSMKREGREYTHPEGRTWAERVAKTEGVMLVTPEYNHGYPGVLKNTLDWVGPEWVDKPVAFVSYSSQITGGVRAVEQLRQVVVELGLVQVANAIHIPRIAEAFDGDEPTHPGATVALGKMFDELERLQRAMASQKK